MSPSETMADDVSQRRQDIGHAVRQRASEGDIGNTMSPSETMGDDVSQQNDGRISLPVRNTRRINTHLVFDAVRHAGRQRTVDAKSLLLTVYWMMLSQKHHLESTMAARVDEVMGPLGCCHT